MTSDHVFGESCNRFPLSQNRTTPHFKINIPMGTQMDSCYLNSMGAGQETDNYVPGAMIQKVRLIYKRLIT